jgi:DMSO/TMAO reductase YedYZ heme-binding membrane subunit
MMLWEIARASAFVAFACYTLVVAWGIGLSSRFWKPPAVQLDFHRFLSSLGLVAVGTHVTALLLDSYAHVSVGSLVGRDPRPGVTLGAIALWLTLALPLSFKLKQARWIGQRAWRSLHYFGYAVWVLALAHGVLSGTDSRSPFAIALYTVAGGLVGAAAWQRWTRRPQQRPRPVRRPLAVPVARPEESS